MVAVTLIPYLFINARTGVTESGAKATNALLRIGIVAFAPIGINAGVAFGMFGMACCMGPLLSMCCKKFGSVLAAIAHGVAVIMLLAIFEVMFFLEGWNWPRCVLGMISMAAIQRFVYKLIIALALTREFKHDQSNIAWWTGKWYNMGWHSLSQPGREFLCKITELGYFAGDFVLGHLLLFAMLPALCVPYIDRFHSVILFWLRPSRQIRPPIYSLKQSKLRRRRVIRYAILYFVMLVVFVVLVVAPLVVRKLNIKLPTIPDSLMQPLDAGEAHNDTHTYYTGSGLPAGFIAHSGTGSDSSSTGTSTGGAKMMFMF